MARPGRSGRGVVRGLRACSSERKSRVRTMTERALVPAPREGHAGGRGDDAPVRGAPVHLASGGLPRRRGAAGARHHQEPRGAHVPVRCTPAPETVLRRQRDYTSGVERRPGQVVPGLPPRRSANPSVLERWVQACARAAALKGPDGKLLERDWEVVIMRPDVLERIPHDLRRTAVRNLERAGVPRSVAMKLTGHKTESVYNRYAIVSRTSAKA